jgi:hypothetical protein
LNILDSLNQFKDITNEAMKDITVSNDLKEKTMRRIKQKKGNFTKVALIPVGCLIVMLAVVFIWKSPFRPYYPNNEISENTPQNANIMLAPENNTLPIAQEGKQAGTLRSTVSSSLKTLEEAKQFIGNSAVIPAYLPRGYELKGIQAVAYNNEKRRSLSIEYVLADKSFVISIEQNSDWKSFEGYKDVNINGITGHMKIFKDGSYESAELRWFIGKSLYTVEGEISEEEAVKVSKSLK